MAIMCSRVLGLIRDMLFAALFPPFLRDCFIVAFRTPNMLRDLFAEGALSTAFVTVFSQKLKTDGDKTALALASRMFSLAAVFMSLVAIAGVALAPLIVRLLAGGWSDESISYTVTLAQIMYPFILLVSLAALVMGLLNARKVYAVPALASSFFNIVSIVGGWGLGFILHKTLEDGSKFGHWAMIGFSIGTLLGGLAQLGWQLPALFRTGFPKADFMRLFNPLHLWRTGRTIWREKWWHTDSDVRRILQLMWPAVIAGSAVQVNVLINTIFASHVAGGGHGPVSWLNYAFRLMQLPLGVFGVAVATVTLPVLSRVATDGITERFREVLGAGSRLVMFLTLPCAVGLFILARPIISVLYERNAFTWYETVNTASALQWYAVGLVFYSMIKVIQPAFSATDRRFIPMYVALGSIVLNAALNSVFVFVLKLDHSALAKSTAIIAATNCIALYVAMRKIAGGLHTGQLFSTIARLILPVAALGAVSAIAWNAAADSWSTYGFIRKTIWLGLVITASGTAYFLLASLMKVGEAKQFMEIAEKKLKRRGSQS